MTIVHIEWAFILGQRWLTNKIWLMKNDYSIYGTPVHWLVILIHFNLVKYQSNPAHPIPSHPFMGYFNLILNGRSFVSSANFGYEIIFSPICFLKHSTVLLRCYYPDLKIHMYSRMGGVPNWPKPVMFIITLWFRLRGYTQQRYQACWMLGNVAHFGVHSCNWVLVIMKWMYNLFNWKFYNTNWNEVLVLIMVSCTWLKVALSQSQLLINFKISLHFIKKGNYMPKHLSSLSHTYFTQLNKELTPSPTHMMNKKNQNKLVQRQMLVFTVKIFNKNHLQADK